jgi:hypothetical protein
MRPNHNHHRTILLVRDRGSLDFAQDAVIVLRMERDSARTVAHRSRLSIATYL